MVKRILIIQDLDYDNHLKSDRLEDLNVNGNGSINGVETNYNGIIDTKGDGINDYYDSDKVGIINNMNRDSDNDGLLNGFVDSDNDGWQDCIR